MTRIASAATRVRLAAPVALLSLSDGIYRDTDRFMPRQRLPPPRMANIGDKPSKEALHLAL